MQYTLFDFDSPNFSKWYLFKNTTVLGKIHQTIDWDSLEKLLPNKTKVCGAPPWLPAKGLFGLMLLKHYTGLSDEKLLESFHTNWAMQIFCGTLLADNERIKDNAFVSRVRSYLGNHLDLNLFQSVMINNWKGEIPDKNVLLMDATCYEVYLRIPTDVKLLWEACTWLLEKRIPTLCTSNKIKLPRSKFKDQKIKQLAYSKLKKKTYRKTYSRKRSLLKLLNKGILTLNELLKQITLEEFSPKDAEVFQTIKVIYEQQKQLFEIPGAKISDRIVSIYKPYIRPIVRGKENKPVEYGIKAHINQVGGINIIEHTSYNAFNECKRLKESVVRHEKMIGECTHVAADGIYPTNENRTFLREQGIQHNFCRKGRGKDDKETKQMKGILNKERSTRLEGSFGTEKEHYLLRKIKARSQKTELVWLFFGVYTANAVRINNRRQENIQQAQKLAA
ncbi:transposase [Arcicella aquatica]|uniref:Transposase n=1 Tax=Arcicella aquatica TaxID=217141 RepID=A0ABU5QVD5_9BACT|nr:transposase [Arcicella aquatica]MEA5261062.1 transposase [Arcicella aquatica]